MDCVHVNGSRAWVGGYVTHSTNTDIASVGTYTITFVNDLGGNGEDDMHTETGNAELGAFEPGDCLLEPALPPSIVRNGNFKVQ